jgi:hypothetical protein
MALDLTEIRTALATQIVDGVADGLNGYPYPKAAPALPAVEIHAGEPYVNYHVTFGEAAHMDVQLEIQLLIPRGDHETSQQIVDRLLSTGGGATSSVIDAVEADKTLGGTVQSAHIQFAEKPEAVDLGGQVPAWRVRMPVLILMRRTP